MAAQSPVQLPQWFQDILTSSGQLSGNEPKWFNEMLDRMDRNKPAIDSSVPKWYKTWTAQGNQLPPNTVANFVSARNAAHATPPPTAPGRFVRIRTNTRSGFVTGWSRVRRIRNQPAGQPAQQTLVLGVVPGQSQVVHTTTPARGSTMNRVLGVLGVLAVIMLLVIACTASQVIGAIPYMGVGPHAITANNGTVNLSESDRQLLQSAISSSKTVSLSSADQARLDAIANKSNTVALSDADRALLQSVLDKTTAALNDNGAAAGAGQPTPNVPSNQDGTQTTAPSTPGPVTTTAPGTTAPNNGIGESFNPDLFSEQSCSPNETCIWDLGAMGNYWNESLQRNVVQITIIKGVHIEWNGNVARALKASNGENRCSVVAIPSNNWLENVTLRDAHRATYQVWEGDPAGWMKTLAVQAAQEQSADYGCPARTWPGDFDIWGSNIPSPPCGVDGFVNCNDGQQPPSGSATTPPSDTTGNPPSGSCDTVNCQPRRASADSGGTAKFSAGEAAWGYKIVMGGKTYHNCLIGKASSDGTVTDGVVNPWSTEVKHANAC